MKHARFGSSDTTAALRSYLASRAGFVFVDLYDITLATIGHPDRMVLRYCDQPFDVTFPTPDTTTTTLATYAGGTHVAASGDPEPAPKFVRGQRKEVIGVEVDTMDLDILLDGTDYLPAADGDPDTDRFGLDEAIRAGLFDGAHLLLRRLVLPAFPTYPITPTGLSNRGDLLAGDTSLGAVTLFGGFITESLVTKSKASLKVHSALERLSVGMPRNIFQAGCLNDLYDGMCRVPRSGSSPDGDTFQAAAQISTFAAVHPLDDLLLTTSYPTDTALPHPGQFFKFGTAQFTDGSMAGITRTIAWHDSATRTLCKLLKPLPRVPEPGTSVLLQAGCAKTIDDCRDKFGNFVSSATEVIDGDTIRIDGLRFRGCARVPPPDSAI